MGMSWLNNIKALRIGGENKYLILYKTGCINDTAGDEYEVLRQHKTGKIVFEGQEAMNYIMEEFHPDKGYEILKRKSRQAECYKDWELVNAFQRALNKQNKFDFVVDYSDNLLKRDYLISSKVFEVIDVEGKPDWKQRVFTTITEENFEEMIKKIENKEVYYYFNAIKRAKPKR